MYDGPKILKESAKEEEVMGYLYQDVWHQEK